MFAESISYSAAFIAGLISFFSPCILPLIPAYFTFITGYSLDQLTHGESDGIRRRVVVSTVSFILGFSVVFIVLGASASLLGGMVSRYQDELRVAGGVVVIVLGLHVAGVFRLKFLDVEKRLHLHRRPVHVLGTFFVGMAFGAGWSPCIGPLLGSILAIAATQEQVTEGMILLSIYSVGLAIPFLVISIFIHLVLTIVRRGTRYLKYVNAAAGALLVVMGVLLIADKMAVII